MAGSGILMWGIPSQWCNQVGTSCLMAPSTGQPQPTCRAPATGALHKGQNLVSELELLCYVYIFSLVKRMLEDYNMLVRFIPRKRQKKYTRAVFFQYLFQCRTWFKRLAFVNIWENFRMKVIIKTNLWNKDSAYKERVTVVWNILLTSAKDINVVYLSCLSFCPATDLSGCSETLSVVRSSVMKSKLLVLEATNQ